MVEQNRIKTAKRNRDEKGDMERKREKEEEEERERRGGEIGWLERSVALRKKEREDKERKVRRKRKWEDKLKVNFKIL